MAAAVAAVAAAFPRRGTELENKDKNMPHNTTAVLVLNRGGSSFSSVARRLLHNDAQDLYPRQKTQLLYESLRVFTNVHVREKPLHIRLPQRCRRHREVLYTPEGKGKRVRKKMRNVRVCACVLARAHVCVCVRVCVCVCQREREREQGKKLERDRKHETEKDRRH